MALDFTHVSGEYCLNTWKAGGAHTAHYAVDPSRTQEDITEFVKASSLTDELVDFKRHFTFTPGFAASGSDSGDPTPARTPILSST